MKAEPEFWGIIDRTEVQQMTGEKKQKFVASCKRRWQRDCLFDNFGGPEKGRLVRLW
jgi:hypothetical protein